MTESPQRVIAEYVNDLDYSRLPEQAVENAKVSILDTIGVSLAASGTTTGTMIKEYVRGLGARGTATVVGDTHSTAPELAAMANGVLAHTLDYDERGHAGTHLLGPVLAMAQDCGADGRQFLVSYIAGREVRMHLTAAFDAGRQEGQGAGARGWHSTGVLGTLGATAAAAKIVKLDIEGISRAFGIAASASSGLNVNWGTMTKPLHAGLAARDGVMATTLAAQGFTSSANALSGRWGFAEAFGGTASLDLSAVADALRSRFHIIDHGVRVKPYPCCTGTHALIEAALEVRTRYGLVASQVASVECMSSPTVCRPDPESETECRFSAQFCIAVALIEGDVLLDNFDESFRSRADVRDLLARVRCTAWRPAAKRPPEAGLVRVRTTCGGVLETAVPQIRDLATSEEIRAKFRECASRAVSPTVSQRIEELVDDLDRSESIAELANTLKGR